MQASELSTGQLTYLHERDRLAAAVQEAGAVAFAFFGGPLKSWTKGKGDSPVTEAVYECVRVSVEPCVVLELNAREGPFA